MDKWRVPAPTAILKAVMADATIITVRRHGNPNGPRMVFSHGCGLAADLYYPYWSLLADRFDLCIFDLRSHGWNQVSPIESLNIATLAADNQTIIEAISTNWGPKPCLGVFHSLSAVMALTHQRHKPDFTSLVLFDPGLKLPGGTTQHLDEVCQKHAKRARRRQRHFASRHELAEMLGQTPAYSLIPPKTLSLLADATLRPATGGGYELRCPPKQESQLVEWYFGFAMQASHMIDSLDIPIKAISSDPTIQSSFLPGLDLNTLARFNYDFIPGKTHFLQLEGPEECATLTIEFLERHHLA